MHDSKLIAVFSVLNIEEKRKLRKWIRSDFVNKNQDIISFFEFIYSRNSLTQRTVSKEKVYEYLYPNTKYNDLRIRHLLWMATEILESFIVNIKVEHEHSLKEKLLSKFYIEKGLLAYANKIIENAIDATAKEDLKNAEYYKNIYDFGSLFYDINSRNIRTDDFKINKTIRSLSIFTIIEVLKSACVVNTIQKVMEVEIQQYLLKPILEILPDSVFLELPVVRIYYNTYLIASNEDDKAFELFLLDIRQNESLFSMEDLNGLYRTAINFCIKKSNQNTRYYKQKTFELYLYTIEKGILIENYEINRFVFTNTITLGIKLGEFNKVDAFVEKYSSFINADFIKNTIDYNTAKILYAKQQPEKALKILLTAEFKDTIWNLNAKFIILKIHFEKEDIEYFNTYLKAFKIFIKRKSNIGYHKNYFLNVTEALTKLLDIYKKPEKYINFEFEASVPDVDWFNKILSEIRKKQKKYSGFINPEY